MSHAFLIEHHPNAEEELLKYLEQEFGQEEGSILSGGGLSGNPDFWREDHGMFGVDESRALKERAGRKAAREGGKKIFVISAHAFTLEAQNALLKLFEEPAADTFFYLITPSEKYLAPTLLSRFSKLSLPNSRFPKSSDLAPAKDFLAKTLPERIALAAEIAKKEKEDDENENAEKNTENSKQKAVEILEGSIARLREKMSENMLNFEKNKNENKNETEMSKEHTETLDRLAQYREYLFGRSPSVKMILEATAVLLPRETV